MTRGNQREIDRQRAMNRHGKGKGVGDAKDGDHLARKEADAKALAEKVAAKRAREEAIARGEYVPEEPKKGPGGAVKKKDGTKK